MQNFDSLIQFWGRKNSKLRVVACFASLDMVSNCAWSISVLFCENFCWQESWTEFSLIAQTCLLLHQFGRVTVASQSIGIFNKTLQHNLRMLLFWRTKMWLHADLILQLARMCALPICTEVVEIGMTHWCHRSCFQQLTLQKSSMPRGPRKRARSAGGCAAVGFSRANLFSCILKLIHFGNVSLSQMVLLQCWLTCLLTYLLNDLASQGQEAATSLGSHLWVGNQSLKIFGGGGGQGRKDIVGILLLNELCWDEIDDITHDSPTAFSFFWSSRWLCSDCQCQQLTLCEYCERYLHLSTILVDWMLSSWSEKGLSRKGICLKQTSSTSIRVEFRSTQPLLLDRWKNSCTT